MLGMSNWALKSAPFIGHFGAVYGVKISDLSSKPASAGKSYRCWKKVYLNEIYDVIEEVWNTFACFIFQMQAYDYQEASWSPCLPRSPEIDEWDHDVQYAHTAIVPSCDVRN